MPKQTLTHDCPQHGRTTLTARWLPQAEQLRATCDDCESVGNACKLRYYEEGRDGVMDIIKREATA